MDSTFFQELITCEICSETFGDHSKCPRMLPCGHSFCHSCIEKLLGQSPSCCPNCIKKIQFKQIESIPVNFSLKSLVDISSTILNPNTDKNDDNQGDIMEHISKPNKGTTTRKCFSKGYCIEHDYRQELRCMDCEAWVCGVCAALEHKLCRIILVGEAYTELRQKVEKELGKRKTKTEKLNESSKVLEQEKKSLGEEIKKQELEIETKRLEIKDREMRVEELVSQKFVENQFCDILKRLHEMVENSSNKTEASKYMNVTCKLLAEGKEKVQESIHYLNPLPTRETLETMCQNGSIYAMEDRYNGVKYGKVNVKDGWIWVHHFKPELPNVNGATIFTLNELLIQFSGTSELPNTVFMELTPNKGMSSPFHIVIETISFSPRAKNFVLLCSALKGSSYLNLPLVDCRNYGNFCHFKKINPGPTPVLEGIRNDNWKTPVKKFSVYGMYDDNSWFGIQLKNNGFYSYEFGFVVSGAQNLYEHRKKCSVTGCGLVI